MTECWRHTKTTAGPDGGSQSANGEQNSKISTVPVPATPSVAELCEAIEGELSVMADGIYDSNRIVRALYRAKEALRESEEREKAEAPKEIYYAERPGYAGAQPWVWMSDWRHMRRRAQTAEAALTTARELLELTLPYVCTNPDLHRPGGDELNERIRQFLEGKL